MFLSIYDYAYGFGDLELHSEPYMERRKEVFFILTEEKLKFGLNYRFIQK